AAKRVCDRPEARGQLFVSMLPACPRACAARQREDVRDLDRAPDGVGRERTHTNRYFAARKPDAEVEAPPADVPQGQHAAADGHGHLVRARREESRDPPERHFVGGGRRDDGRGRRRDYGSSFSNRSASSKGPIRASRSRSSATTSSATRATSSVVTASI